MFLEEEGEVSASELRHSVVEAAQRVRRVRNRKWLESKRLCSLGFTRAFVGGKTRV